MPSENVAHVSRLHARQVVRLPSPPETFKFRETELTHAELQKLRENGILIRVDSAGGKRPHDWRVRQYAYDHAATYLDNTDGFVCCGGRGVRNIDGTLHCTWCNEPVSTAEFRRVLGTSGSGGSD